MALEGKRSSTLSLSVCGCVRALASTAICQRSRGGRPRDSRYFGCKLSLQMERGAFGGEGKGEVFGKEGWAPKACTKESALFLHLFFSNLLCGSPPHLISQPHLLFLLLALFSHRCMLLVDGSCTSPLSAKALLTLSLKCSVFFFR